MRLIDESGNRIIKLEEAMELASDQKLDLVEIDPNANPPVVRILDYGKFKYQKSKQTAVSKKKQKQHQVKIKEIKFRPTTDTKDFQDKLRFLRKFLEKGYKVKVTVWFRGREMAHQELGAKILERVRDELEDISKVEFFPKMEGRQLVMVLASKKS